MRLFLEFRLQECKAREEWDQGSRSRPPATPPPPPHSNRPPPSPPCPPPLLARPCSPACHPCPSSSRGARGTDSRPSLLLQAGAASSSCAPPFAAHRLEAPSGASGRRTTAPPRPPHAGPGGAAGIQGVRPGSEGLSRPRAGACCAAAGRAAAAGGNHEPAPALPCQRLPGQKKRSCALPCVAVTSCPSLALHTRRCHTSKPRGQGTRRTARASRRPGGQASGLGEQSANSADTLGVVRLASEHDTTRL
jgi:hypothetical protein